MEEIEEEEEEEEGNGVGEQVPPGPFSLETRCLGVRQTQRWQT